MGHCPGQWSPAHFTALTPAQVGLQLVESCVSLQGRKTMKAKETLYILVGLYYLVARELDVLPKPLFHSAGAQYWPVSPSLACNVFSLLK